MVRKALGTLIRLFQEQKKKKRAWLYFSNAIKSHTKLTQVQAEVGSFHQAGVLTHGPDVEVHEDRQASEGCHSEPHQEEQVGQEHQLQTQKGNDHKIKLKKKKEEETKQFLKHLGRVISSLHI